MSLAFSLSLPPGTTSINQSQLADKADGAPPTFWCTGKIAVQMCTLSTCTLACWLILSNLPKSLEIKPNALYKKSTFSSTQEILLTMEIFAQFKQSKIPPRKFVYCPVMHEWKGEKYKCKWNCRWKNRSCLYSCFWCYYKDINWVGWCDGWSEWNDGNGWNSILKPTCNGVDAHSSKRSYHFLQPRTRTSSVLTPMDHHADEKSVILLSNRIAQI